MSEDHTFCRLYVKEVMKAVRKYTTAEQRKKAWAWKMDSLGRTGEFHGPDDFYWHGSAHCLWEARAKGWEAWMQKQGFEG